jgi:hypothetical protein
MYGTYHIEWDVFATSIKKTSLAENTWLAPNREVPAKVRKVERDWERRERKRRRGNEIEASMVANEADE